MSGHNRDASEEVSGPTQVADSLTSGGDEVETASSVDSGREKATGPANTNTSAEVDFRSASAITDARGDDNTDEIDGEPTLALASAIAALDGSAISSQKSPVENHEAGGNEEEEKEYFCGLGPWHPPWLQWLRDARVFTFLLCLFSAVEGALVSGNRR